MVLRGVNGTYCHMPLKLPKTSVELNKIGSVQGSALSNPEVFLEVPCSAAHMLSATVQL